jgi:hypothetical protein
VPLVDDVAYTVMVTVSPWLMKMFSKSYDPAGNHSYHAVAGTGERHLAITEEQRLTVISDRSTLHRKVEPSLQDRVPARVAVNADPR